jgi:hypothetical protein
MMRELTHRSVAECHQASFPGPGLLQSISKAKADEGSFGGIECNITVTRISKSVKTPLFLHVKKSSSTMKRVDWLKTESQGPSNPHMAVP